MPAAGNTTTRMCYDEGLLLFAASDSALAADGGENRASAPTKPPAPPPRIILKTEAEPVVGAADTGPREATPPAGRGTNDGAAGLPDVGGTQERWKLAVVLRDVDDGVELLEEDGTGAGAGVAGVDVGDTVEAWAGAGAGAGADAAGAGAGSSGGSGGSGSSGTSGASAYETYEPVAIIGKGSFGVVTKIRRRADGRNLVWKALNYGPMREKEKHLVVSEVNILRELRHPFIVRYYDRIIEKQKTKIYIVMEFCEGGDLGGLISKHKKEGALIEEDFIWKVLAQILLALKECHRHKEAGGALKPILHRDIKPGNVFLDAHNNVKMGDFGLAKELQSMSKMADTNVGTPFYMSPEMTKRLPYNEKSDIWAVGCLLYELAALRPPFEATNPVSLAMKIDSGKVSRIPSKYSEDLYRVIRWMLKVDQAARPTVEELERTLSRIPQIRAHTKEGELAVREYRINTNYALKHREIKSREEELRKREAAVSAREKRVREREELLASREASMARKLHAAQPSSATTAAVPAGVPQSNVAVPYFCPPPPLPSTSISGAPISNPSSNGSQHTGTTRPWDENDGRGVSSKRQRRRSTGGPAEIGVNVAPGPAVPSGAAGAVPLGGPSARAVLQPPPTRRQPRNLL